MDFRSAARSSVIRSARERTSKERLRPRSLDQPGKLPDPLLVHHKRIVHKAKVAGLELADALLQLCNDVPQRSPPVQPPEDGTVAEGTVEWTPPRSEYRQGGVSVDAPPAIDIGPVGMLVPSGERQNIGVLDCRPGAAQNDLPLLRAVGDARDPVKLAPAGSGRPRP